MTGCALDVTRGRPLGELAGVVRILHLDDAGEFPNLVHSVIKRIFDFIVSGVLFLLLLPVFLLVSIGVLMESGWPLFYVSTRVGQHGRRTLGVLKFRTMVRNADLEKEVLTAYNHRQGVLPDVRPP